MCAESTYETDSGHVRWRRESSKLRRTASMPLMKAPDGVATRCSRAFPATENSYRGFLCLRPQANVSIVGLSDQTHFPSQHVSLETHDSIAQACGMVTELPAGGVSVSLEGLPKSRKIGRSHEELNVKSKNRQFLCMPLLKATASHPKWALVEQNGRASEWIHGEKHLRMHWPIFSHYSPFFGLGLDRPCGPNLSILSQGRRPYSPS